MKATIYGSDTIKGQVKAKSDKDINKAGQEFNRAKATVALQQRAKELDKQEMLNMQQQMMNAQKEQELMDMMAKLDYQQKLMQNVMNAQPDMMAPFNPQDMGAPLAGGPLPNPAQGGAPPSGIPMDMAQAAPQANNNMIPLQ